MTRLTILLAAALAVGCVSKKNYNAAIESADTVQADLKARIANLEGSLANAEAQNATLTDLTEQLDAKNETQADRLSELSEKVAKLSTRNATQREEKAELEALLAKVQDDAAEAEEAAKEARDRATKLAEERAQLEAEKDALEQRTAEYDALVDELEAEIDAGQVTITELSGKLTVNLSNAILFDSGKTEVKKEGKEALMRVASILKSVEDREIQVEGHTDNVPVTAGAPYPDNWALSSLRASNVVALLVAEGLDPLAVASVGYGEHRPAASNDTAEGRASNRRIEIVLAPRLSPKDRTARR